MADRRGDCISRAGGGDDMKSTLKIKMAKDIQQGDYVLIATTGTIGRLVRVVGVEFFENPTIGKSQVEITSEAGQVSIFLTWDDLIPVVEPNEKEG